MNNHCTYYSALAGVSQCLRLRFQPIGNPLIQAFVFGAGGNHRLFMNGWRHTHVKLTRIGFFRRNALFSAYGKEYAQRCLALFVQVVDIVGVKVGATVQTDKLAAKHSCAGFVGNKGFVAVKSHNIFHADTIPQHSTIDKPTETAHNGYALAKSSVSDWRRYIKVTQARHTQSVLFLCLKNSLRFMVGCVWDESPLPPLSSTPTRTVCHPNWRWGDSVTTLIKGGCHA